MKEKNNTLNSQLQKNAIHVVEVDQSLVMILGHVQCVVEEAK
jgi:hypothetical protein